MNMQTENHPGRFGYFAAVAVAVGSVVACAALIVMFISRLEHDARFVAPGSYAITVQKAGKQIIWNDYRTVFEGRAYDQPEQLPNGLSIRVTEAATGKDVDIVASRGASSKTSEADRVSIATFEAEKPGRYTIRIEGDFPPRVFSVGPEFLVQLFGTIFGAIAVVMGGLATAMGLAIWTFLRRHPSSHTPAPATVSGAAPPPVSPVVATRTETECAPPEESARQMAIVVYVLQAASFVVVVSMIGGVILNYVKREDAAGTWL